MSKLQRWISLNQPGPEMYWHTAAVRQFEWFQTLSLGFPSCVADTHRSKSIELPVVTLSLGHARFAFIRDNFNDINVKFESEKPFDLDLADLYGEVDWGWYCEKIGQCEGYSWKGWSAEELADPRITRVKLTGVSGNTYWSEMKPVEKERWSDRWSSPEWLHQDWGRTKLLYEGEFGPATKLYAAEHPFAEGIQGPIEHYKKGCTHFTIATNREGCERLIKLVKEAS